MAAKRKSLAEQLAEAANPEPKDYDPEDFEHNAPASDSDSEASEADEEGRTSHYISVEKSRLRDDDIVLSEDKYKGSRTSRRELEDDFEETSSSSDVSEDDAAASIDRMEEDSDDASDARSEASGSESSDEEQNRSESAHGRSSSRANNGKTSPNGVAQILSEEQKHLLSRLSASKNDDAEKGKAVAAQMKVYEGLLDMRMQVQKILNASNKLTSGEPTDSGCLHGLIADVLALRARLSGENVAAIDGSSGLDGLVARNRELDDALAKRRESVLTKWSRKVELSSGRNALNSNRFKSLGQSAALQVNSVLGDMDRLEKRTRVDRSNYGLDELHPWLFDDTDFYRLQLKDLVDRRLADSSAANGIKWKAAASVSKQKKTVDTKASKGRRLRYNVIEKIQGFDAPRNVFTWSDKQAEDLYSGLLGVKISMDDAEPYDGGQRSDGNEDADEDDVQQVRVTDDFNLFG